MDGNPLFSVTLATKITLLRFLLVPFFVACVILHARAEEGTATVSPWLYAAISIFILAGVSDVLDGYVARRYNQISAIGSFLDPLADKFLVFAALLTLTFTQWPWSFPIWFPIVVIGRDFVLAIGYLLLKRARGQVRILPHWTGKGATFLQIVAIAWVLLQIPIPHPMVPTITAAFLTLVSGGIYIRDALRQLHEPEHVNDHITSTVRPPDNRNRW